MALKISRIMVVDHNTLRVSLLLVLGVLRQCAFCVEGHAWPKR